MGAAINKTKQNKNKNRTEQKTKGGRLIDIEEKLMVPSGEREVRRGGIGEGD